ncbi:MAG: ABC transporter ATP-binding protein, partial [Clostridia bacterium]|nr:ABC transporter ATP-binding protein [Clostridia bacterium]
CGLKQRLGMTILYITHDMGVIAGIADDLCVMYLGRIIEQGSARQIFHCPAHPYTVRLLRSIPNLGRKTPGARLDAIRGNVPVPLDPKDECGFCSRCDEMQAGLCDSGVPGMVELEPGHFARCVKLDGKRVG